jgi:hypothetical protein
VLFRLTALRLYLCVKLKSFLVTAGVESLVEVYLRENWLTLVIPAIKIVSTLKPLLTVYALQCKTPSYNSPKEGLVVYHFPASDKPDELFEVESTIRHMLSNYTSVKVDKNLGLWTSQSILRLQREQLIAVGTSLEHIRTLRRLQEVIKFSHIQFRHQLVFFVNHFIKVG